MSEELQSLVQIIELYGRGLEGLGKAIRFSAKGAEKGVQIAQVKALQHRMKLHYASEGTHNTMKLSDLEKMTGGRYTILNIPLEDEKELIAFYDRLKKLKVSFSELPDLNLGDGYTQIAYNPDDMESVRLVIDYYKKKFRQEAKEMDLDEYFGTASPGGLEYLDELAAKGYEGRMHEEQLEEIQKRISDKKNIFPSASMWNHFFCGKKRMPICFAFPVADWEKIFPVPYGLKNQTVFFWMRGRR